MTWSDLNQRHLLAALAIARRALERHARAEEPGEEDVALEATLAAAAAAVPGTPALDAVASAFRLTAFERDVLLLAAGCELDARFEAACAAASGDDRRPYATFGLALAVFPDAHWSALSPGSPLRYWRLVEPEPGADLANARLRVAERVLHELAGVSSPDAILESFVEAVPKADGLLLPSAQKAAQRVAAAWRGEGAPTAVALCGTDPATARDVASAAAASCGLRLHAMRLADVPGLPPERAALVRRWEREAILSGSALLLHAEDADGPEAARSLAAFVDAVRSPLVVAARDGVPSGARPLLRVDVERPSPGELAGLWREALGKEAEVAQVERVAAHFGASGAAMRAALAEYRAGPEAEPSARLWNACRAQARPRLDGLAERIAARAGWDDLVLPAGQAEILRDVVAQVRAAARVLDDWGFAAKTTRGLGVTALFAGASGTGKTLAAEVVARELDLDLYRVDLSQVVSKYIGETEKNLRRVFDAAEAGGVVLLFDEADALFGKRSEVKDSHDRYANIEVSYLLQRMEAYRGLAILTTNLKGSLDSAFLRRLRFVVHFPFPGAAERAEIWRRAFPPATPTEGLDPGKLARLNVAGGSIRNIAVNAACLAADAGTPVRMSHVLRAARAEYAKSERTLADAEVAGWV